MPNQSFVVAVIDDDDVIREALAGLLAAHEYEVELYASAEEFLGAVADSRADCLLVDIHLDGIAAGSRSVAGSRRPASDFPSST